MGSLTIKRVEGRNRLPRRSGSQFGRRLLLEPLEDRTLLSLLGVSPTYPVVTYDSNGTINYNADSQVLSFVMDATPLLFRQSGTTPYRAITPTRDFLIQVKIDNQGQLIANQPGSDLTVIGNLDIDGNGTIDYSGTLLTGKATQFGYYDSGTTSDKYDFRFTPTGGSLASFYAGKDIGITTTSDSSTFAGNFNTSFSGLAKGTLGSISALWSSVSGYVYNDGVDNDGIKQVDDAGIAGVSVTLTGTDIGGNSVSASTVTNSLGAYSFLQLRPGTYAIAEIQPAGWLDGKDSQGTPGTGTTENDLLSNIVLSAGVNGQNNNFGELPMLPGVNVSKLTNGIAATEDNPPLNIASGSPVIWTYVVSNTGNVNLSDVAVTDDQNVTPILQSGDNGDGLLNPGEVWTYTATGTAVAGNYSNAGVVVGTATDATGTIQASVSDRDTNYYFGVAPAIQIVKLTNGVDNNAAPGGQITVGDAVTWTYNVSNTGNVALASVTVTDSDLSVQPIYQSGDTNLDSKLDISETWLYTAVGAALEGQYANIGTATGTDGTGTEETAVSASDVDYYFGKLLPSSLSGFVYNDTNDNNVYEPALGESGINGTVISLSGVDDLGRTVSLSTVTDANGGYAFGNLRPGTYSVAQTQPAGYLDGKDSIGSQGGQVGNDLLHDIILTQGVSGVGNNFGELSPGRLSGFVWLDANDNGEIDLGEMAVANVTVSLTGMDDLGNAVNLTEMTDANGYYSFGDLRPGTYKITETQQATYVDGKDSIGTQGGTVGNDQFSNIVLNSGTIGINNNFGERPMAATQLAEGMTATIGFWHNKNGQALLKSVNGSSNSTALGNWLAATLPNLYGATTGVNALAGKSNTDVANYFLKLFSAKGQKLEAQVLAVAFATYVTNSSLAGGTMANAYGFTVNTTGTGAAMYNVGSNGAAFGVANNTTLSILNILNCINDRSRKGVLWDMDGNSLISSAEQALRNMGNTVCTAINETGDIG